MSDSVLTTERLSSIFDRCKGAYADKTMSGYGSDLRQFQRWCAKHGASWAPTDPETLARFVDDQSRELKIATVKRRVEAIKFAHRLLDLPTPADSSAVLLALRRAARQANSRPQQSLGLTNDLLQQILMACPTSLAGLRDAALLSTGYDTLCRSSELAAMRVEHLEPEGASLLIPRSKADIAGSGRMAYLSRDASERLARWIKMSGIKEGPLFQGLHTARPSGHSLNTASIRRIVKRAAMRAGLKDAIVQGLSGHSMRIGAAQDMMVAGFDQIAIMQAGGWKSVNVLGRYVENAAARRLHERRWHSLQIDG